MSRKNKYDKPLKVDMEFDEMMQRISKVDKNKVEANIKRKKTRKIIKISIVAVLANPLEIPFHLVFQYYYQIGVLIYL